MVSLKFIGVHNNEEFIEMRASTENKVLHMRIEDSFNQSIITLDRETAIKFSKELRKQISLIHDQHE